MHNPEARPLPSVPWLFDGYGLSALLLATVVSSLLAAREVALLAGSLLLLGLLARLWARFSLERLGYQRSISPARAFCGDTITLETSLANRKLLPLAWVEVWERLPGGLHPDGEVERSLERPEQVWFSQGASLWPYQRARWRHQLRCLHRGVFNLPRARVRSGDPFGLCEREDWLPHRLEVVVYPRVVPLRRLALPIRASLNDVPSRRSLIQDPTRTVGPREYRPGDPQRLIHWRATARQQELQVRVLEPSSTLQVCLVLDGGAFASGWELYRETLFELTLSALASIAVFAQQRGAAVGLVLDTDAPVYLPPGAGPAQLEALLQALARVRPGAPGRAGHELLGRVPRGSAVILATSDAARELPATAARFQSGGQPPLILLAGSGSLPAGVAPGTVLRLLPERDLAAVLEGRA